MKNLIHVLDVVLSVVLLASTISHDASPTDRKAPAAARVGDHHRGSGRLHRRTNHGPAVPVATAEEDWPTAVRTGGNRSTTLIAQAVAAGRGRVRESAPAASAEAVKPWATFRVARVDFIMVNRVRSVRVSHDEHGREVREYFESWWLAFFSRITVPVGYCSATVGWIDQGWWPASNCNALCPCSEGWMADGKEFSVVAPFLLFIESGKDMEVEWRSSSLYLPLR